ncbi:transporter [Mesonia sp. K7]|uniref:transporter n=1 Tax=Mesonia sp. K7 TaxID=2218606 RepID=UPI000DA943F6|nr:transporter [Mesonia sp. K7]PZD79301.1 transporter [Mesonia sp. K7]
MKPLFFIPFLFFSALSYSQYTETINSNRPGNSQGAFAVGYNVLQFEAGARMGQDDHELTGIETDLFGIDYQVRYGLKIEQLEISLIGSHLTSNHMWEAGGETEELKEVNFESNTLGGKYLLYDPYKNRVFEKPNIISWHANHRFKWRDLIPAVSVYAGANLLFGENPYKYDTDKSISPRAAIITQNNWGRWVFVMNFIGDKMTEEYPTYAGIFTMTHSVNGYFSVFAEYQAIKSDLYADDIARAGAAYLFTKDFQIDVSGLYNFKDTPRKWQVALGLSYRFDMHTEDEIIMEGGKKQEDKHKKKKNSELVNPDGSMNED